MNFKISIDRRNGNTHNQCSFEVGTKLPLTIDHPAKSINVTFHGGKRMFNMPGNFHRFLPLQEQLHRFYPVGNARPDIFLLTSGRHHDTFKTRGLDIPANCAHIRIENLGQILLSQQHLLFLGFTAHLENLLSTLGDRG